MAATNVQAFSGDVEVANSITKKHNTTYNTGTPGWYNLGTWNASAGARLLLTLIGGASYNQGTSGDHGGETKIAATILNDAGGATNANIRGSFWHIGGKPIATNVKFVQANVDRLQYHVYAYILDYTTHAMDVDTTLNTTFTKTFTSVSDPGGNDATVQAATLSFVSTDGNVGIGTTSPGNPLDIYNASIGAGTYALKIQTDSASSASPGALGPGIGLFQRWWSAGNVQVPMAAIHCIKTQIDGTDGGGLAFRTGTGNLATKMVIDHDGDVGIGTTSPFSRLTIMSDDNNSATSKNPSAQLVLATTGADLDDDGDIGPSLVFTQRWYESLVPNEYVTTGSIHGYKNAAQGNYGGGLIFKTQPTVSPFTPLERMRINAAGYVGINRTPEYRFDVNGQIRGTSILYSGLPWFFARNQTYETNDIASYNVTSTHLQAEDNTLGSMYSTQWACLFPIKGIYVVSAFVHSVFNAAHTAEFSGSVRYSNGSQYYPVFSSRSDPQTTGNYDHYIEHTWVITTNATNMYLDLTHVTSANVKRNYAGGWNRIRGACIYQL